MNRSSTSYLRTTLAGTAKATGPSEPSLLHCSQRELSWHWVRVWGRITLPSLLRTGNGEDCYQSIKVELKIDAGRWRGALTAAWEDNLAYLPRRRRVPENATHYLFIHFYRSKWNFDYISDNVDFVIVWHLSLFPRPLLLLRCFLLWCDGVERRFGRRRSHAEGCRVAEYD